MAIVSVSVEDFLRDGCKCNIGTNNTPCLGAFSFEEFVECRDQIAELSNEEKDMLLLGFFMLNRTPKWRMKKHGYKIYGLKVCKKLFYTFLTSNTKYKNVALHYLENVVIYHVNIETQEGFKQILLLLTNNLYRIKSQ